MYNIVKEILGPLQGPNVGLKVIMWSFNLLVKVKNSNFLFSKNVAKPGPARTVEERSPINPAI